MLNIANRWISRAKDEVTKLKRQNFVDDLKTLFVGDNLDELGRIYRCDKTIAHHYTQHYQTHFNKFKNKKINLLEIGVGGYDNPYDGGQSLRLWKRFFSSGKIYSIDIYDKSALQQPRIKIFQGSQVDEDFLNKVTNEIGDLDIIIDDGSHINEHVITTFKILFPKLKDGGIYVVEDTQTSYWKGFGGDSENLQNSSTMLNFFKGLTDSLNNKEFLLPGYVQTYYDKKIISMHFYHNMVFIYKGNNDEESNYLVNNAEPVKK